MAKRKNTAAGILLRTTKAQRDAITKAAATVGMSSNAWIIEQLAESLRRWNSTYERPSFVQEAIDKAEAVKKHLERLGCIPPQPPTSTNG